MNIENKDKATPIYNTGKRLENKNGVPVVTTDEVAYIITLDSDGDYSGYKSLTDELYNIKTSAGSFVKGVDDDTNKVTLASGEVLPTVFSHSLLESVHQEQLFVNQ
jgi:hypothetical protein